MKAFVSPFVSMMTVMVLCATAGASRERLFGSLSRRARIARRLGALQDSSITWTSSRDMTSDAIVVYPRPVIFRTAVSSGMMPRSRTGELSFADIEVRAAQDGDRADRHRDAANAQHGRASKC